MGSTLNVTGRNFLHFVGQGGNELGAIRPIDAWAEYQCYFWRSGYPAHFGTLKAPVRGQLKKDRQ